MRYKWTPIQDGKILTSPGFESCLPGAKAKMDFEIFIKLKKKNLSQIGNRKKLLITRQREKKIEKERERQIKK